MTTLILDGQTNTDEYFKQLDGLFAAGRLTHTPLLVFVTTENVVTVRIVDRLEDFLALDDETPVMGQWRGEWRSDFFNFTVGKYRRFMDAKFQPLKSAQSVIKRVGPQGGFRYLSYEYIDEHGTPVHAFTSSRVEAALLEGFFAREGISVTLQKER